MVTDLWHGIVNQGFGPAVVAWIIVFLVVVPREIWRHLRGNR